MSNLNRVLKNLRGDELKRSFPRNEEEKAQPETVGNVIINALASYPIKDRREMFSINKLASDILGCKDGDYAFSDDEKKLLSNALFEATFRTEDKEQKGAYFSWMIAQVFEEVGITK